MLISMVGYTQKIQLKTIDKNNNPISFVKVSSGGDCIGFTDENGLLKIDKSNIVNDNFLLYKSIYLPEEVNIEIFKNNYILILEKLGESEFSNYSKEATYTLIEQVFVNSQKSSPKKQLSGLICYSHATSIGSKQLIKNNIKMQFLVTSTKIKALKKIDKMIKVWLKSTLKSEPIRYQTYKFLHRKSAYTYSVESSYINELRDTILIINIKDSDLYHTQLVINKSKKIILEFHNYCNDVNHNGISEPEYHAIYSLNNDLLYPEYLVAKYYYQKNEETDTRKIQILFKEFIFSDLQYFNFEKPSR